MRTKASNKVVPGFFDLKEAAACAKCSVQTLKNHINAGKLKAFQPSGPGGTIVIPQGNLVDFITSRSYGKK